MVGYVYDMYVKSDISAALQRHAGQCFKNLSDKLTTYCRTLIRSLTLHIVQSFLEYSTYTY